MKGTTAYSKSFPKDSWSLVFITQNKLEENRTIFAHSRQQSSFVDSDILAHCYLFIMLFYSIGSDSRLYLQLLPHCNIEMQYRQVFYKYLHSKDSHLDSIYTNRNAKVSYTKLVPASCIFKWRRGHKILEIIFSLWIWNEQRICIFYVQS